MKITIQNIHNLCKQRSSLYSYRNLGMSEDVLLEKAKTGNETCITEYFKYASNLIVQEKCNEEEIINNLLDIVDSVNESSKSKAIEIANSFLLEVSDKVRDPKQMAQLVKRRTTLGTTTKGATAQNSTLEDLQKIGDKVKHNLEKNTSQIKDNLAKALPQNTSSGKSAAPAADKESSSEDEKKKKDVKEACYDSVMERCEMNSTADRIIRNYSKLSKRFNIDKVFYSIKESISDNIDEYCSLLETWSDSEMSPKSKFNVAIETALYMNSKLHLDIDESSIIEAVTDYFLFRENQDSAITNFDNIFGYMQNNSIITESDIPENFVSIYNEMHDIKPDNYGSLEYYLEKAVADSSKEKAGIKKLISDFKATTEKTPENLKKLITKCYASSPSNIIEETPNLFIIIRWFVIIGSIAIHPILGIVTFMTDQFLALTLKRPDATKMAAKYEKELEKVNKKIEKTTDEKKKDRLKQYKKSVEENLRKIKQYEDDLYTEEENEKREAEKNSSSDDFDFDLESAIIAIAGIESFVESTIEENKDGYQFIHQIKENMPILIEHDMLDQITEFARLNPDVIDPAELALAYEDAKIYLKNSISSYSSDFLSNRKLSVYREMTDLSKNIDNLKIHSKKETPNDINKLISIIQFTEAMKTLDNERHAAVQPMLEVSFKNTLNIVKTKMQDAVKTVSDTEKKLSSNIDTAFSGFISSVERMFTSTSREQVIRGSIIPSASKILKMCLGAGLVAWMIHPVVAVIGILGYIGVSKSLQAKERQLILDEIDTELQMVDKYIDQAEQKNDMKALKQLLTTKKRLQREDSRIRYKMRNVYNQQPIPKSTDNN